jgi:hypothetical protein
VIRIFVAAAVMAVGISAQAAQTRSGSMDSNPRDTQKCKGMTGVALEDCLRQASPAGKNDDSGSESDRTKPGSSPDAAQPGSTGQGTGTPRKKK